MSKQPCIVLVDTNLILEAHWTGTWNPLTGGYRVETVEDCVIETQTGFQRRRQEQQIDESKLRKRLAAVHSISNFEITRLMLKIEGIELDIGEKALWAHALGRNDDWILCGPDKASYRCGVRLGMRERLVSLEELLHNVGYRPRTKLCNQYTKNWHDETLLQFVLAELSKKS